MGSKLLFIFVLCLSTYSIHSYPEITPDDVRGLIESAQEALKKLTETVTEALNSAVDKLKAMVTDIINYGEEILNSAKEKINGVVGENLQKIKDLEEQAEKLGIDVSECIVESKETIVGLPEKLARSLLSCVTDKIEEGKAIINGAIDQISGYPSIVTDLMTRLQECGTSITSLPCIGRVLAETTAQIVKIPVDITTKVYEITKFVTTIKEQLVLCGTSKVIEAGKNCTSIVFDVVTCYNKKLEEAGQKSLLRNLVFEKVLPHKL